jgi:hypothetical protein
MDGDDRTAHATGCCSRATRVATRRRPWHERTEPTPAGDCPCWAQGPEGAAGPISGSGASRSRVAMSRSPTMNGSSDHPDRDPTPPPREVPASPAPQRAQAEQAAGQPVPAQPEKASTPPTVRTSWYDRSAPVPVHLRRRPADRLPPVVHYDVDGSAPAGSPVQGVPLADCPGGTPSRLGPPGDADGANRNRCAPHWVESLHHRSKAVGHRGHPGFRTANPVRKPGCPDSADSARRPLRCREWKAARLGPIDRGVSRTNAGNGCTCECGVTCLFPRPLR